MNKLNVGRIGLTGFTLGFLFSGIFFVYRYVNYDSTNPDPALELMFKHLLKQLLAVVLFMDSSLL